MIKRPKVVQVGMYYPPVMGGMEVYLHLLCQRLKKAVDVEVLVNNTNWRSIRENYEGIPVTRVGTIRVTSKLSEAWPITLPLWMSKTKADIWHFHLANPIASLSYLVTIPKGKLVVTYHMDIIKQKSLLKIYEPFLLNFLQKADIIIATSPQYVESSNILKNFRSKCVSISYGIDIEQFRFTDNVRKKSATVRLKYGSKIVLFVGRLTYYKGIQFLIKAMANVDANLLVVGKGYMENKLKTLVENLHLQNKVFFIGNIPNSEIASFYYAANVFVLPSIYRTEAFGIVLLEAHACRLPTVSTRLNTGVEFVNQHGITGLTVNPMSSEELSEAINMLLNDSKLSRELGSNAHQRVQREFTIEKNAERILHIYRRVLDPYTVIPG